MAPVDVLPAETDSAESRRRRFASLIGGNVLSAEAGHAQVALDVLDSTTNAMGFVHGGAIAGLVDLAITSAARCSAPDIDYVVTITFSVSYLKPARGRLLADARVLSSGTRIATTQVDIRNSAEEIVATALGTLRLIRSKPPSL